jgi:predicted Zn-dependent peptidase
MPHPISRTTPSWFCSHAEPRASTITLIAAALCVWLCACSSAKKLRVPVARPAPPPSLAEKLPAGSTLAVPRPTPGAALLSLWFDAGSRDANPAPVAAATAWWAENVTGAQARVLPDGTELTLLCDTQEMGLAACIKKLAQAFAMPAPSASDMQRLRERIRGARLRAKADFRWQADELAFGALFGAEASELFALGKDAHDAQLDGAALMNFASDHYVPARSLLIAAGDVDEDAVARAFAQVSANLAKPGKPRSLVSVPLRTELAVEGASESWIALAMAAPSFEEAAVVAHRFHEIYADGEVRAARLRGANLVHVRLPASEQPTRKLQRAVFDLRRLSQEIKPGSAPVAEDSAENIVRLLGESWAARGSQTAWNERQWPIGAALLVRDNATSPTDSNARLQRVAQDARNAFAAALENSRGETRGKFEGDQAHAKTANGLRIEIRRRSGDAWMSAVVRFRGGSALDPATRHGRAALLATLMADGCGVAQGRALDSRLLALDATIRPLVDARHVGILISAPVDKTDGAVDLLLRCAVRPALTARALEDARLKLLRSLWGRPEARLQAALGQLLWPTSPGAAAPWGAPYGLAAVQIQELRRLHAELLSASRAEVFVVADRAPEDLAQFVARRVAQIPAGHASEVAEGEPGSSLRGELTEAGPLRAVIGLRADSTGTSSIAPQLLAELLSRELAPHVGGTLWSSGDVTGKHAWAGLAVSLGEAELAALEQRVRNALRTLASSREEPLRARIQRARLELSMQLSSARGLAAAFFSDRSELAGSVDADVTLLRQMTRAAPAFFVLRPAP